MLMLDLCAGLGGASQAMRARGWTVISVDSDPRFGCTVTADVRAFRYAGPRPDLICASPPCTEFSRESMPWCRTGNAPDTAIVTACKRIIDDVRPRFWAIENVRGSVPWLAPILGTPSQRFGPFVLWATLPPLGVSLAGVKAKQHYSSARRAERAKIPAQLSYAVAVAVEQQQLLLFGA